MFLQNIFQQQADDIKVEDSKIETSLIHATEAIKKANTPIQTCYSFSEFEKMHSRFVELENYMRDCINDVNSSRPNPEMDYRSKSLEDIRQFIENKLNAV